MGQVAQLVSAFKDLLEIREAAVGHLMEETNEDIERLKEYALAIRSGTFHSNTSQC